MREHVEPTARLHYIYELAGVAPNVVPDESRVWMMARDATSAKVSATTEWLRQLAEGAAMGTQTKATFEVPIGSAEMIPNETLALRVLEHMQYTPLNWSDDEQKFAKACQKEMGLKDTGMATKVMPLVKDMRVGGSSDVADVSWNTPTIMFGWPTLPMGVSLHSWAVTACGGMSIGDKGSLAAATILAALGYDLLTDSNLRNLVKDEWKERLDGREYVAVLDVDPKSDDETALRFGKGTGEEALSGIDGN
jgi:aminobenzoyl-glutamate utilization protein B